MAGTTDATAAPLAAEAEPSPPKVKNPDTGRAEPSPARDARAAPKI
jgi:hypothetical protein